MKKAITRVIDSKDIEAKFVFSQEIRDIRKISDEEGKELAFHRNDSGNNVIFTKDNEGVDVAIEHCIDGTKIFHLSEDSKGLPAMHEFKPDGSEVMYLLDESKKLEKSIETKANGDKVTTWVSADELVIQEQRQTGGTLFRLVSENDESLVWLHPDGNAEAHGNKFLTSKLISIFAMYLDGADIL